MKAHQYQVTVYEGILDSTHRAGQTQDRLYIHGQGVLGYRDNGGKIDFFGYDTETIAEAMKAVKGSPNTEEGVRYLGEIELPDDVVSRLVSAGKSLNQAKADFEDAARTLVDLLK